MGAGAGRLVVSASGALNRDRLKRRSRRRAGNVVRMDSHARIPAMVAGPSGSAPRSTGL